MSGSSKPDAADVQDRRCSQRRRRFEEHGILGARVRPGLDVTLIDVSAGGALIETGHRLLPGSPVELQLTSGERHTAIRGRVLRCAVARLRAAAVWYRGAIAFDRSLPWFVDDEGPGYVVPGVEIRPRQPNRAAATRHVL